jgi:hypothetical protein
MMHSDALQSSDVDPCNMTGFFECHKTCDIARMPQNSNCGKAKDLERSTLDKNRTQIFLGSHSYYFLADAVHASKPCCCFDFGKLRHFWGGKGTDTERAFNSFNTIQRKIVREFLQMRVYIVAESTRTREKSVRDGK